MSHHCKLETGRQILGISLMLTEVRVMYSGDLGLSENSLVQFVGLRHIYAGVKCHDVLLLWSWLLWQCQSPEKVKSEKKPKHNVLAHCSRMQCLCGHSWVLLLPMMVLSWARVPWESLCPMISLHSSWWRTKSWLKASNSLLFLVSWHRKDFTSLVNREVSLV